MESFGDDTYIVLARDDNYWGKALFGRLPAPKHIVHLGFESNEAGSQALQKGQIDYSQLFIPKVWELWKGGAPIKTYLDALPYHIPGTTPAIVFNVTRKGLERKQVRRAIAESIDYERIGEEAMSGYTDRIVPGIALGTPLESKFIDGEAVAPLTWTTNVTAANELLDSIGAKRGPDGIRVLEDGTRLGPYEVVCPAGWSDWNTALEIVARSAKKVGIEIRTKFLGVAQWLDDQANGDFDLLMNTPAPWLNPGLPWDRARAMMSSEGVPPIGQPTFWNWGRFKDARADELLRAIPTKKDAKELKRLYTELDRIYLENVPSIQLMYRPWMFYTVNSSVWSGFPDAKHNPKKIPPTAGQAGIRIFYEIRSAAPAATARQASGGH